MCSTGAGAGAYELLRAAALLLSFRQSFMKMKENLSIQGAQVCMMLEGTVRVLFTEGTFCSRDIRELMHTHTSRLFGA